MSGREQEQESIGALLARLFDDARTVAKAELTVFRTDFYRRIGRARTGALLCLIGAIMGQAAAVTFLVTLSFVLTPWIGRLGGAAVSVVLGVGLAVILIRAGVKKLMLVVEDIDDDDKDDGKGVSRLDELFSRMRERSQLARAELAETVGEAQARLHPQALLADLADEVVDRAQLLSHATLAAVRRRPARATAAAITILLLMVRPPIYRFVVGLGRATRRSAASLKRQQAARSPRSQDEETIS
ncbi:DUF3618 domain-containing protein [Rhizorhabdus argentea]|uniref:DUF3618 domain-containing protein n=1 Tax=Rhizorhabdus argentea TaxID=1387174 RepID=UPI0030EC2565